MLPTLFIDIGACRGNPGASSSAAYIKMGASGKNIATLSWKLPNESTNNCSEYLSLIMSLNFLLAYNNAMFNSSIGINKSWIVNADFMMDSELVINQVNGTYKVKSPSMLPLYDTVKVLLKKFESSVVTWRMTFNHVDRSGNVEADSLANAAIRENHETITVKMDGEYWSK